MIRRLIIFVFAAYFIFTGISYGKGGKIQGTIKMADGTPLPGVSVSIAGTSISTTTDRNGLYAFTGITRGRVTLIATLDGFKEAIKEVVVSPAMTIVVDITLEMAPLTEETVVEAERPLLSTSETVSTVTLTPRQIETLPSLGEKDVFRAFQLLPGISGSNEASSGLYVRGGTPDQNLISYDGFTIYHVDHLFGYFSAFNMEAINDIQLSKGGYESKYGGRLSSVMELTGNTGDLREFNFGAGINLLSFNGLAEIPLFNKGSLFVAGRHSFQSPLYDSILDMFNSNPAGPGGMTRPGGGGGKFAAMFDTQPTSNFYDVNAKLSLVPTEKDDFWVSFYNGKDDLDNSRILEIPSTMLERMAERGMTIEGDIDIIDLTHWGNTGVSANWLRDWSLIFQTKLTLAYSNYFNNRDRTSQGNFRRQVENEENEEQETRATRGGAVEDNDVRDVSFKMENVVQLNTNNRLEFGAQITSNDITYIYDMDIGNDEEENQENQEPQRNLIGILNRSDKATQFSAYAQDRWTLFDRLTLIPGIRLTYYDLTEESYYEPRVTLNFRISDAIRLKGAWGKYNQFINRITREDVMQGNREFWSLSDGSDIPVGSAIHYVAGISYEVSAFLFDVEAYYKNLSGLSEFALRFTPRMEEEVDYNQYFYQGKGIAKGVEFLLQKKYGKYYGWICYTLSQVEYDFPDLSENPYPALHDQTHEFKIVNIYELGDWSFSGTWIYATGKPYTEPIGTEEVSFFNGRTFEQVVVGEKNDARLPAYHRLDLSASYRFNLGGARAIAGLTLFNVYNRKNVWYKEFDVIEGEIIENNIQLIGFTLNISFSIKF